MKLLTSATGISQNVDSQLGRTIRCAWTDRALFCLSGEMNELRENSAGRPVVVEIDLATRARDASFHVF